MRKHLRHLSALQRRADWLAQRIAQAGGENLSFDKQELSALLWAIKTIEALYREEAVWEAQK